MYKTYVKFSSRVICNSSYNSKLKMITIFHEIVVVKPGNTSVNF